MSQKIYLDDCVYDKDLVLLLKAASHVVMTPAEAGLSKQEDEVHFRYAASHELVLLTKNPIDFRKLHEIDPQHAGILAIYQDNDPSRDMSLADIVRAIANLESAGVELRGTYQSLNAWRY